MKPPAMRLITETFRALQEGREPPEPLEFDPEPEPPPPLTPEQAFQQILSRAKVPAAYLGILPTLALHPAVRDWEWDSHPFVTFLGPVGSGKTWQATRLLGQYLADGGGPGLWMDATLAVEQIRQQIASDSDSRLLNRMIEIDILLLDDLLAERDSEFARDKLSLILRSRYNDRSPTIITSNSTDANGNASLEAIAKVEPRLASRIAEGIVIKMGGRDRRIVSPAAEKTRGRGGEDRRDRA